MPRDDIDFPISSDWRGHYARQGSAESVPEDPPEPEFYPLRQPCKYCGGQYGHITETNGQAVVRCDTCDRWLYNAPKKERGLAPATVRTDGISPSVRYRVAERAGFRCEICGASAVGKTMHVGHLVSEKDLRDSALPPEAYRDEQNLSWLCAECNLGMGAQSLSIHDALVFMWRKRLGHDGR